MKTLGMLLGSASQTEILRSLAFQPGSVGLRQVARIAGIHPHSAELALAALGQQGLVRRKRSSTRPLYSLDRSHVDFAVLEAVFAASARAFIQARSRTLNQRARSILPFVNEASRMIHRARKTRHVA